MHARHMAALVLGTLLASAAGASAQSCLGFPSRDGDLVLAGSWVPSEEVGGDFHADVSGPGAFGFAYRTALEDGDASTYEVRGSYDFYMMEPAICAVAGLRYTDLGSSAVSERLAVPVGIGIGKTLSTGAFATTVYAIPQYMWVREVRTSALDTEETVVSNEFTGEAGLTVGALPLFFNGAVVLDTLDDDPAFRLRVGLIF